MTVGSGPGEVVSSAEPDAWSEYWLDWVCGDWRTACRVVAAGKDC